MFGRRSSGGAFDVKCLLMIGLLVASAPVSATTATFRYEAFLGPVRAGEAVIEVETTAEGYEVRGRAKAQGLLETFGNWRARFSVACIFGKKPETKSYYLFDKDDRKMRDITVQDGMLKYIKNGKMRSLRPALPGVDVLTTLFIDADCKDTVTLHTGRHGYHLRRYDELPGLCRYRVTDEDGEQFDAEIRFGQREGFTVPVSIEVRGMFGGRMQLIDSQAPASAIGEFD